MVDQLDLHARGAGEVGDRRGRQAADPEEGVDLPVLDRVHRFGDAEALAPQVLVLVEAGGFDDAERHDFGRAAARSGGHALAFQVGDLVDAGALDRYDVHAVRIHHHEGAHRDRLAGELVLALVRIERRVRHGHAQIGLAGADELQVGHRAAGHLGRGLHARNVSGEHGRHAAAQRVVHATGSAGGDRKVLRLPGQRERRCQKRDGARQKSHGLLLGLCGDSTARRVGAAPPRGAPALCASLPSKGCRRGCPSPPAAGRSSERETSTAIPD